jgi:hypothetical protein
VLIGRPWNVENPLARQERAVSGLNWDLLHGGSLQTGIEARPPGCPRIPRVGTAAAVDDARFVDHVGAPALVRRQLVTDLDHRERRLRAGPTGSRRASVNMCAVDDSGLVLGILSNDSSPMLGTGWVALAS